MKVITVEYYAALREARGCSSETIETGAETAGDLYAELAAAHAFSLRPEQLRVIVNEAFVPWETPLRDHDTVVFIPPVAGG
jgi:molybdopterin converting factor small subunit